MKKQREYRIGDLQAIVNQMGGRLHLQIVPEELCRPQLDPHALAMALRLARLLNTEGFTAPTIRDANEQHDAADWLRSEVEKELAGQS